MGSRERRARRGNPSLLEQGWIERDPTGKGNDLTWAIGSPIGDYLTWLGVGLSQREACEQAHVNRSTVQGLLTAAKPWMPTDPTPDVIRALPEGQPRRLVAFAAEHEARRVRPKAAALASVMQAINGGDWRAGISLLKLLYREEFADRVELTGKDGGPIEVDAPLVAEKLRQMITNMVDAAKDEETSKVNLAAEVNPEGALVAPVKFPSGEAATPGQQAATG